jgi:hypothetical protein
MPSRVGGQFYLSNDEAHPPNNGAILNIVKVIDAVIPSAAEAELGVLFINAREAVYLQRILTELCHPQPKTLIQIDNLMVEGVIDSKIQPKCTKLMDMQFEWLKDREARKDQFQFFWRRQDKFGRLFHPTLSTGTSLKGALQILNSSGRFAGGK